MSGVQPGSVHTSPLAFWLLLARFVLIVALSIGQCSPSACLSADETEMLYADCTVQPVPLV